MHAFYAFDATDDNNNERSAGGANRADVGDLISRLDGEIDCSTDARRRNPLQAHDRFGRNATTKTGYGGDTLLRCPFAERGWLRPASQASTNPARRGLLTLPLPGGDSEGVSQRVHVKGSGDSPAYPHMPDRDVARPRRTALTRSEELSEDGTRNLSASGPNGGWSGDTAYAGFFIDYKPRTARDDPNRRGDDSKTPVGAIPRGRPTNHP